VPASRLRLKTAVVLPSPADGRIVFLIPCGDRAIVGTTDTDYSGDLDRPRAERDDVEYLLGLVNENLPGVRLARGDVLSSFAGLRPLLLDASEAPSKASREHEIVESRSGLITVTGGKLTTYRLMSRQVVDRVTRRKSTTHRIDLYASGVRDPLSRMYGTEAARIVDRDPLVEGLPHVWGEVDHAVDCEMARTLTDVLARRMRLALYAEDQGRSLALSVARRMAPRMGWDRREISRQVEMYERELEESYPR
jgi:glycerol-3-phosphate dehydrogenase